MASCASEASGDCSEAPIGHRFGTFHVQTCLFGAGCWIPSVAGGKTKVDLPRDICRIRFLNLRLMVRPRSDCWMPVAAPGRGASHPVLQKPLGIVLKHRMGIALGPSRLDMSIQDSEVAGIQHPAPNRHAGSDDVSPIGLMLIRQGSSTARILCLLQGSAPGHMDC